VRIDHRFSDNDNIFFRYTQQNVTVFSPIGNEGSTGGSGKGRNYGGAWTHTFNPNVIFDIRAGYAGRPGVDSGQQNQHEAGVDPLTQAGFLDVDKYDGLLVTLQNWTAGGNNNFGIRGAALRENPNWSVTPNVTWLKGNHSFKMGGWYLEAKRVRRPVDVAAELKQEGRLHVAFERGVAGLRAKRGQRQAGQTDREQQNPAHG